MDFKAVRSLRRLIFVLLFIGLLPTSAMAQVQFFDDFERTDSSDLGQWTALINPQPGQMSYAPMAAKVGNRGLRFVDDRTGAGEGLNISLVKEITPVLSPQSQYIRAWIRLTSVTGSGRMVLLKIEHQSFVATEVFLQPDLSLQYLVWQKDGMQRDVIGATAVAGVLPLGQWILLELGAVNLGTANGIAWASIDGQEVMRKSINWTNLYVKDVIAGLNYGANELLATIDYDAFAATAAPPPTRILTQLTSSTAQAGACVAVQFVLQAAFDQSAQPAFHPTLTRVDLSGSATGALFSDAQCTQAAAGAPTIATGQTSSTIYVRPVTAGTLTISPVDADFLTVPAALTITPDDPQLPDSGPADSGLPDAGVKAGDAGDTTTSDGSVTDAGTGDPGVPEPQMPQNAGLPKDGLPPASILSARNYAIGCGCSHGAVQFGVVLLLVLRRFRKK